MNLRLQPDTLPYLRLSAGGPPGRATQLQQLRHQRARLEALKTLVFFGLILPLLITAALLFLATFGP